jgi:hypothetical protein
MIVGYARVSTDGQTLDAHAAGWLGHCRSLPLTISPISAASFS